MGDVVAGPDPRQVLAILGPKRYAQNLMAYPRAIGQVRRVVEAHLRYWGRDALRDAISLCTTEMLTNVAKHTRSFACVLILEDNGTGVRLTVSDSSKDLPTVREVDWSAESGRGIRLLTALATSYGSTITDAGKDVWAIFLDDGEAT